MPTENEMTYDRYDRFYMKRHKGSTSNEYSDVDAVYKVTRLSEDRFNIINVINDADCGNCFTMRDIQFYLNSNSANYEYLSEKEGLAYILRAS